MKANPRRFGRPLAPSLFLTPVVASLGLAACVSPPAQAPQTRVPQVQRSQAQTQTQPRRPAPTPAAPPYRPASRPPVTAPPSNDWRDVPATPGTWRLVESPAGASASFANGLLTIRCDRAANTVTLSRTDSTPPAPGDQTVVAARITTSELVRSLSATSAFGTIRVAFPARDSTLDAIAFSRGRFLFEVQGRQPLYVPSWTEISRVVEDCR